MPTTPFRVAHLTDLHAREQIPGTAPTSRRRSREALLARALAAVKAQRADLLVITGDLLDVPLFLLTGIPVGVASPGDSAEWLDAVRRDYLAARKQLDDCGIPYRILPGNHDHAAIFAEVFHDQGDETTAGGYRWITFTDHEQEGNTPRRLLASRHLFNRVLTDGDPTPQIHLQHYLFHQPPTGSYPYIYAEADWLRSEMAASGRVRMAISGHYHTGRPLEEENGIVYTVGEAFGEAPHPWRIYEFNGPTIALEHHSLAPATPSPVVFLDRDGVINDLPAYTFGPERMALIPGAARAIRRLNEAGIPAVVVTSQSSIGAGYVTRAIVDLVNERMQQLLAAEGAALDAIYYTQGAGEATVLPALASQPTEKSTLLEQAFADLPLLRDQAWIVGDRLTDIAAGTAAGVPGILVRTGYGAEQAKLPDADGIPVVDDLDAAVTRILNRPHGVML